MKTIKQIANEIGVSKQAVYKRYKHKLYTELCPYAHVEDKTIYISEKGEDIIKNDFLDSNMSSSGACTDTSENVVADLVVDTLIQTLQEELKIKNKQIEELTEIVRLQAESINANCKNQLANTIIDSKKLDKGNKFKMKNWLKIFSKGNDV